MLFLKAKLMMWYPFYCVGIVLEFFFFASEVFQGAWQQLGVS
jgi:hypothetical protein